MYALQLASKTPSAILDWNNNFDLDPDKCILFHCSNLPTSFCGKACMDYQTIIAGSVGIENAYGAIMGRIKTGPATYCRTMTDDIRGIITTYVGEADFVDDPVETFGGYGVLKINRLQDLLQFICRHGFEHHVALSFCSKAKVLEDAFATYLGWEVYRHV
jgi:L-fucose isomerase-like protein